MSKLNEAVDLLVKGAVDNGQLIYAGWLSFNALVIPADAPAVQREEMRRAFFAGAQHLFASIMSTLEAGSEPTDADLRRMSNIDEELRGFIADFKRELR